MENVKNILKILEEEKKNKNELYSIKIFENYRALTVKVKGREKIAKILKDYHPKNEKEKILIEELKTKTHYGKSNQASLNQVLELLQS